MPFNVRCVPPPAGNVISLSRRRTDHRLVERLDELDGSGEPGLEFFKGFLLIGIFWRCRIRRAEQIVKRADLLIGAVLVPGAAAPKLVTRDMLQTMKSGAVLVDIAIDQGGCFETSHPTSHSSPTYVVDGVVHYCVANMPAAVARTSTFALNNVTLPFTIALADKGWRRALLEDPSIAQRAQYLQRPSHLPTRRRGARFVLHCPG